MRQIGRLGCATALACVCVSATGQQGAALPVAPSAVVRPLVLTGGTVVEQEQPGVVRLSLDDAIAAGLKANTQLKLREQAELGVKGQRLEVANALMPTLTATAYTRAQEINLAAMGFKSSTLEDIHIPGVTLGPISEIVKVNTTDAQMNVQQTVFNVPAYYLYRAAQKASEVANWATLNQRGGVVIGVGADYLRVLADRSEIANAAALVKQDEVVLEHAQAKQAAGVGIHLDVLRAQVDLENEQQRLVRAQNAEAKDVIALNREMGAPAGQALELTDTVPFAELNAPALEEELKTAYARRKDLLELEAQLEVAGKTEQAVRFERLPTVGFGGFYGVLGETTGLYHGVFTAEGKVSFPIFQEAELRGQREVARAQTLALKRQIDAKRAQVEADIRTATLDVQSTAELVKVAHSNVELAGQALSDATMRFTSGVDDDLAVVRAQAALEGAQTQVVQAEFQYNYAKLVLARNTGVVETQYKQYLGR